MNASTEIRPYRVDVPQADLDDLATRLDRALWANEIPGSGAEYGVPWTVLAAIGKVESGFGQDDITWADVRKEYYRALDESAAPMIDHARTAFERCSEVSKKFSYSDALSKHCEDWLAKNPKSTPAPAPATP